MQFTSVAVFSSLLLLQTCFAVDPIQNYVVKNEIKDRISHDERIQERLSDRKAHDYRVLNQIAQDTAVRGGAFVGDAQLQNTLQYRIASDNQAQHLLNDRIAYDKRLLSGAQNDAAYNYPYYQQYYQQQYYPQVSVPAVQPVAPPPVPVAPLVKAAYEPPVYSRPPTVYSQSQAVYVPIVSYSNDINPDGSYKYGFVTGNGISVQEEGGLRQDARNVEPANTAVGSFAYTSPEGVPVSVSYTADENGFHARTAYSSGPQEANLKYRSFPQVQPVHPVVVPVAPAVHNSALDINPKLGRPLFSEQHTP